MHSISSSSPLSAYLTAISSGKRQQPSSQSTSTTTGDSVSLSPAGRDLLQTGRIALNEKLGNITSDQATQLYSQVSAVQKQVASDKAAGGGTLDSADVQSLESTETQNSQLIYSGAHNGAAPPTTPPTVSSSELRNIDQYARVGLNREAGNLTATQASTLDSQIQTTYQNFLTDQQGGSGSITGSEAASIQQAQNQLSVEINSLASTSSS